MQQNTTFSTKKNPQNPQNPPPHSPRLMLMQLRDFLSLHARRRETVVDRSCGVVRSFFP